MGVRVLLPSMHHIYVQDIFQDLPSDTDTLNLQECDDKILGLFRLCLG
jgi:hypothetical protein